MSTTQHLEQQTFVRNVIIEIYNVNKIKGADNQCKGQNMIDADVLESTTRALPIT